MKILKLVLAAALTVSSFTVASAPAAAASTDQRGDRWDRGDRNRDGYRGDRRVRRDRYRGRYGYNRGYNRGRHYGWRRQRICRTVWRHHRPVRYCYWVNRRWR